MIHNPKTFEILFEDEYLMAINKPPGMLVIPDRFNKLEKSIIDILKEKNENVFVLHRLDRDTSGALLFAKTEAVHRELSMQFESHKVGKKYIVLVSGVIKNNEGIIDLPLAKKSKNENIMIVDRKNGKESITHYKVIKRFERHTLVEAFPKTGRTHQIRIHFKSINYPLAIDKLYSRNEKIFLSDIKTKFKRSESGEKPLMERLTLHSNMLEFTHPVSFNKISVQAPLWKDFKILLKNLEKYSSNS
jgi:23S rRNA pseudouridine1911/1915/1917 synthase